MFVNNYLSKNPFFDAYYNADLFGKLIFVLLITSSILSWILIGYKFLQMRRAKMQSKQFRHNFQKNLKNPLSIPRRNDANEIPFYNLYLGVKKLALDLLNKNQHFGTQENAYLTSADADFIDAKIRSLIGNQIRTLEKNLYILSTITGLSPLLGLLGTVWGITTTFANMQGASHGLNHTMLGGLSLALTTTVLGLLTAIPALIAYNYLKNSLLRFETEMDDFASDILTSIELQYRKVE